MESNQAQENFNVISNVFWEPFAVSSPIGDSVVANRFYMSFPILLFNRLTLFDLEKLDMLEFDVIFIMDW